MSGKGADRVLVSARIKPQTLAWLQRASFADHGGRPSSLVATVLDQLAAGDGHDMPTTTASPAAGNEFALVRAAMMALPKLAAGIEASRCSGWPLEQSAKLVALAQRIEDGVRGYVRFCYRAQLPSSETKRRPARGRRPSGAAVGRP
jgi:hypothetical protein